MAHAVWNWDLWVCSWGIWPYRSLNVTDCVWWWGRCTCNCWYDMSDSSLLSEALLCCHAHVNNMDAPVPGSKTFVNHVLPIVKHGPKNVQENIYDSIYEINRFFFLLWLIKSLCFPSRALLMRLQWYGNSFPTFSIRYLLIISLKSEENFIYQRPESHLFPFFFSFSSFSNVLDHMKQLYRKVFRIIDSQTITEVGAPDIKTGLFHVWIPVVPVNYVLGLWVPTTHDF